MVFQQKKYNSMKGKKYNRPYHHCIPENNSLTITLKLLGNQYKQIFINILPQKMF